MTRAFFRLFCAAVALTLCFARTSVAREFSDGDLLSEEARAAVKLGEAEALEGKRLVQGGVEEIKAANTFVRVAKVLQKGDPEVKTAAELYKHAIHSFQAGERLVKSSHMVESIARAVQKDVRNQQTDQKVSQQKAQEKIQSDTNIPNLSLEEGGAAVSGVSAPLAHPTSDLEELRDIIELQEKARASSQRTPRAAKQLLETAAAGSSHAAAAPQEKNRPYAAATLRLKQRRLQKKASSTQQLLRQSAKDKIRDLRQMALATKQSAALKLQLSTLAMNKHIATELIAKDRTREGLSKSELLKDFTNAREVATIDTSKLQAAVYSDCHCRGQPTVLLDLDPKMQDCFQGFSFWSGNYLRVRKCSNGNRITIDVYADARCSRQVSTIDSSDAIGEMDFPKPGHCGQAGLQGWQVLYCPTQSEPNYPKSWMSSPSIEKDRLKGQGVQGQATGQALQDAGAKTSGLSSAPMERAKRHFATEASWTKQQEQQQQPAATAAEAEAMPKVPAILLGGDEGGGGGSSGGSEWGSGEQLKEDLADILGHPSTLRDSYFSSSSSTFDFPYSGASPDEDFKDLPRPRFRQRRARLGATARADKRLEPQAGSSSPHRGSEQNQRRKKAVLWVDESEFV